MRILFVVLSPIGAELGAAQMAINLSRALRNFGTDVVVWSPHPIPSEVRWWQRIAWMRRRIAAYVEQDGSFDIVDAPPIAVTRSLARQCKVIARNVQPELLYFWAEIRHSRRARPVSLAAMAAGVIFNSYFAALVLAGWFRATRILCLGSLDYEWMTRWLPWFRGKLAMYFNAISDDEREALAEIRRNRKPKFARGVRFIWIGRWSAQKGPDLLLEFAKLRLEQFPNDRITIAGCGSETERYLPASLVRDGKIHLVPAFERRDLPKLLADHDAGLFTSRVEGWGLTLQEMLESGMPVYATTAGAVVDLRAEFPDLIRTFPPDDSERIDFPEPTILSKSYTARFSWKAIAEDYLKKLCKKK